MKINDIEKLVVKIQENDEKAFESLYRYFYPKLYASAYKLCHNDADAKDAVQMTFIQVRQSIHKLQQPAYFPLWVNRIVSNKCKNIFRYHHDDLFDDEYFRMSNRFVENHRDANAKPYSHFESDKEILLKIIQELPLDQQEVLKCTYFQQLNNDETAKILHVPVGTVKSRLYVARKTLKEKIERYEAKEGIALDFKAETIGTAFVLGMLRKQASIELSSSPFQRLQFQLNPKVIMGSMIGKASVMLTCTVLTFVGVSALNNAQKQPSQHNLRKESFQETTAFPSMNVMEREIDSDQDAYYLLRGWAYDEAAMKKKSNEQVQVMTPVYQALQKQNGVFYDVLKNSGWSTSFEEIINN